MCKNLEHLAAVADHLCIYRGCQVDSVDHPTACYQMNTGRRFGGDPAIGAWTTYGLGTLNQNLPAFIVLPEGAFPQGGAANWSDETIDGMPAADWAGRAVEELSERGNVRLLNRTTVWGYYDGNVLAALERVTDHRSVAGKGEPRHRHWSIRAGAVVLATGAFERPLVFPGDDRPGIMLAGAA